MRARIMQGYRVNTTTTKAPTLPITRWLSAGAAALVAAACTMSPPPTSAPDTPGPAPETGSIAVPPPAGAASTASLPEYRRLLAEHVHAANADRVYEGRPPNPLRAVIVYQADIDARGQPTSIRLYRSPGSPSLEARVVESLRRAAPFPPPPATLLAFNGRFTMTETWLFDNDGRFRLRTLSLPQDPDAGN